MRRTFASIMLLALVACSSAGVCWAEIARSAHACCGGAETMAPAKGCDSALESVAKVTVALPFGPDVLLPAASTAPVVFRVSASEPDSHGPSPPLVLRI